ncbi:hypothetical protein SAMN04488028_102327 [Reichenbachiella agariperforans]|uniref:Outer membrane protein beta-barrel domain-containing protein n=1 Tax=Reichenbachiella agariperforans TaxID=156994 RepID=A0A1M6NN41_REIAG|nr:hypothetical protein [Reichenbachiella agariperforans]SHJ97103.1 hypothetical protein SAMN04488028_102327 [Reichenbachiella agariperforans]
MRRFLGLFCLLSSLSAVSQNDFRAGFIINHQQDTISGYIDYRGNKTNSEKCFFKSELDSEDKITYTPQEIQSYRFIDSKYYVAQRFETKEGSKMVFTEYLIDGIVDFYYYFDSEGGHYLIDCDGELRPLNNEEVETYENHHTYKSESKEYVGLLRYAFRDSPTLMRKAGSKPLNHKNLINLGSQYHAEVCADESCIVYEKKLPAATVNFGPLIGGQLVWLRSGENAYRDASRYLNGNTYSSNPYGLAGLFVRINLPNLDERVYFQYEISYQRWTASSLNVEHLEIYDIDRRNYIVFDNQMVSNSLVWRFHFPNKKLRPILAAGVFMDFIVDQDGYRDQTIHYHDGGPYDGEVFYYPTGRYELSSSNVGVNSGIAFGSGLVYQTAKKREIHMDLKYQLGLGYFGKMSSHQLLFTLGYGLIKRK